MKKEILNNIQEELSQINQSDFSFRIKLLELRRLLDRCCKEMTESEVLQFPSLFSRIVFIAQKYQLPQNLERGLHQLRILSNFLLRDENNVATERQYYAANQSLQAFLYFLQEGKSDNVELIEIGVQNNFSLDQIRVQVIDIQHDEWTIVCRPQDSTEFVISVRCNVQPQNDIFNDTFNALWVGAQLNLIDCKVDSEGFYIPSMVVLEPDYLIDASAMAECFQSYGSSHLHYFRRKFEPMANTHYILLGNLANFFLDELIYAETPKKLEFNEVFLKSFKEMPFEFTACDDIKTDIAFRDFMFRAKQQFENIKRVVLSDMPENGFSLKDCTLEPSFYSEKYGFQGRLDLLQLASNDAFTRIVELKSGKTPWPQDDVSRIAANHEVQTSVYRLMIQSVFDKSARAIHAMILYSSANVKGHNLRLSAPYKQLEKEILNIRNLIVNIEHKLYTGSAADVEDVFSQMLSVDSYDGRLPDFFIDKLTEIQKVISNSSKLEQAYFFRFVSFIARELYLQKVGDEGYDSAMSTSALWNTSFQERENALELVANLEIEMIEESARDMKISFKRRLSADFVNFREGEICIVYPRQSEKNSILTNQILKGTVIEISTERVLVRFRYKQRNKSYFENNKYWVIEHDKLDHAYNNMYKSIFAFLQAPKEKKNLLLGLLEPKSAYKNGNKELKSKEEVEKNVIDKAIAAEDYFLIVGPPGTGKTSIFARQLIERYYAQPDVNILVMAYTNRAVDELCTAICAAFDENENDCERYIRIGSEYSCNEAYRHRLLQNISAKAIRRDELLQQLQSTRIYIGTLASIVGKPELFGIKKFEVAIIDEASQILEPQIIGLLPLFDKFIMIGDHKQLSTITLQNELKSAVNDDLLNNIGLYDCRESIFERLFRRVKDKGWENTYATLDYHGRMHEEIARLVNDSFYEGKLRPATERQVEELRLKGNSFVNKRVSLIHIDSTEVDDLSDKTNLKEAQTAVNIAQELLRLYQANGLSFEDGKTLGVIAPYRNQIALIKHLLEDTGIPELQSIMVDTVERYQGSQRDVIIVSFCFNKAYQMRYFANMNKEGTVDRKLNVALTRAREQLFLVGNERLLRQNKLYNAIINKIN